MTNPNIQLTEKELQELEQRLAWEHSIACVAEANALVEIDATLLAEEVA